MADRTKCNPLASLRSRGYTLLDVPLRHSVR